MAQSASKPVEWYLLENPTPSGPFGTAFIAVRLSSGTLSPETLACPVGHSQWEPIRRWKAFNSAVPPTVQAEVVVPVENNDNWPPKIVVKPTKPQINQPPPIPNPPAMPPLPSEPVPPSSAPSSNPYHWTLQQEQKPKSASSLLGDMSALPKMAQAICIYCLYVSPILWVLSHVCCCSLVFPTYNSASPYYGFELGLSFFGMALGLGMTIVLFIGGLKLRQLKPWGPKLLVLGLGINLAWAFLSMTISYFVQNMAANDALVNHMDQGTEPTIILLIIALVLGLVFFASFIFEIVALVWLLLNYKQLSQKE